MTYAGGNLPQTCHNLPQALMLNDLRKFRMPNCQLPLRPRLTIGCLCRYGCGGSAGPVLAWRQIALNQPTAGFSLWRSGGAAPQLKSQADRILGGLSGHIILRGIRLDWAYHYSRVVA